MERLVKLKKLMIGILILFGITTVKAQTLVLLHADGTTTDVELATQPKVTFENNKVLITSTILNMEYPKQDVLRFTFKSSSTGIRSTKSDVGYTNENGKLVFHGVSNSDKIGVYTLKGIRVPVKIKQNGNHATLSLLSLSPGAYIINVNGKTSKIIKR